MTREIIIELLVEAVKNGKVKIEDVQEVYRQDVMNKLA